MKIKPIYYPIIFFATLALGILIGSALNFPTYTSFGTVQNHKSKLNTLLEIIDKEYVDNINTDSIVDVAITNILDKLDPHSVYIPPSEQTEVAQSMKGDFVGIGVNFYMYNDSVAVIKPVKDGPSEKAGIIAGDRILYANKYRLFGKKISNDTLFSKLKGEIGTEVELTIYRKSKKSILKKKVKRDVIAIKSVDIALMLDNKTGYIKINRFAENTYDEFKNGLSLLKKQGMKSLIVDVRENGGGYMEKAIAIADEFLKDNSLIVFTKNKSGKTEKTFATTKGDFEQGDLYILIDENSASASEILAGAIQDNDRGTIIGRRSFGKGLVQREINFQDGSAVRLTIARYYTPSGRSIQKPYNKGNEAYSDEFDNRFKNGELFHKDSIKQLKSIKYKTKKGKIVYGGGGIAPDLFVPLEVNKGEESVIYLMQSGILSYFVFEQLDKNKYSLNKLSFDQILNEMSKNDMYFNDFQNYLDKSGLMLKLIQSKSLVKKQLTAEFVRQLFDDEKYFKFLLSQDAMIKPIVDKK